MLVVPAVDAIAGYGAATDGAEVLARDMHPASQPLDTTSRHGRQDGYDGHDDPDSDT